MFPCAPRVLCAEGNEDICSLEGELLEKRGFQVVCVSDAGEALRFARSERFDLYVLAYKIKGGDGVDLCRRIRKLDTETPILFWSALVRDRDREEALAARATIFLRKPEDLLLLADEAARLKGGRASEQSRQA